MNISDKVTNVKVAGLGGMGVLKAALILGELLFEEGCDVKKAEVHGMAQRGGSVSSDVRFGKEVVSPIIPEKETDYLISLEPEWSDVFIDTLREGGVLISPKDIDVTKLPTAKALNIALLGVFSKYLDVSEERWLEIIAKFFPAKLKDSNEVAFKLGRNS